MQTSPSTASLARVGRLVLASAVNPRPDDHSVVQAMGFDRALGAFAEWCVRQSCGLGEDRAAVTRAVKGVSRRAGRPPAAGR